MLINPVEQNDLTMRFRRAPQGVVAKIFDWIGVIALTGSVLSLFTFWIFSSLEAEGTSLRVCLTCLNVAIISFVSARLVELADRVLQMSTRDRQ